MSRKKKDAFTDDLERTLSSSIAHYSTMDDADKREYEAALWERLTKMMSAVGLRPKLVVNATTGQTEVHTEPVD